MKVKNKDVFMTYTLLQWCLLVLSFSLLSFIKYGSFLRPDYIPLILLYIGAWTSIIIAGSYEELYVHQSFKNRVYYRFKNLLILIGITSPIIILFKEDFSRTMIFATPIFFIAMDFCVFTFMDYYNSQLAGLVNKGKTKRRSSVLVIGAEGGLRVMDFIEKNKHLGYEVVGYLDDRLGSREGRNILGTIRDLPQVLQSQQVDEIVIATKELDSRHLRSAVEAADYNGVRINFIPDFIHNLNGANWAFNKVGLPVIDMREIPLDHYHNYFIKRLFDILASLLVLILISPILLVVALLIKLDSRGPLFYKPVRKGQHGKQFSCYKFRTMYAELSDNPNGGKKSTVKGDPRITRLGKYLRKYNIDELPQLLNVLKGDMSVIGPRPHRIFLDVELQTNVKNYMLRYYIKPGITGWAQVNGWRGPTETEEQRYQRVHHDLWYIENWSLWLDIQILFRTVFDKKCTAAAF